MEYQAQQILSAYRGQTQSGRGEGPSIPIAHGEQYLKATSDELYDDELLRFIRPWLTLDSTPSDHQRLQDQLEGWSCFTHGGKVFVVRLASAGIYDRRAAYFSHARAWPLPVGENGQPGTFPVDDPRSRFDPAVYLGCSCVFDKGEAWIGESNAELERLVPSVMPAQWLPLLRTHNLTATVFLAHLLQAMEKDYPLLIAAPIDEFKPGSALFTLVAFARAALPADLKDRCAIRLYTCQPERFIRNLKANLVALPEDNVADALAAQGRATLLDLQGKVLKTSHPLDPAVESYAEVAVAGILNQPQGLLPFSAYVGLQRRRGLRPEGLPLLQLSYILAMALTGDEADREEVFRDYMRKQGSGLPWGKLLDDGDWVRFPVQVLGELVLAHPATLKGDGERELQETVAAMMERSQLALDDSLPGWWQQAKPGNADGSRWFQRLMQLLADHPRLFRDQAKVAEQTRKIPLSQCLNIGIPLHGLLEIERNVGVLGQRAGEFKALATLAKSMDNYAILAKATRDGQLNAAWVGHFIDNATVDDQEIILQMVNWLLNPADLRNRGELPLRLLDCLRRFRLPIPNDLAEDLLRLGESLDIVNDWALYIRLADLLSPNGEGVNFGEYLPPPTFAKGGRGDFLKGQGGLPPGSNGNPWNANPLMRRLWNELWRLDSLESRKRLIEVALDANWRCLTPALLVEPNGQPRLPWPDEVLAEPSLNSEEMVQRLNTQTLLEYFRLAGPDLAKEQVKGVCTKLTQDWHDDPRKTTNSLVRFGAWLGWRREARYNLAKADYRHAALAWLACPLWCKGEAEATMETWKQVIKDLEAGLSGEEMRKLRDGKDHREGPLWPRILFFEENQCTDLARLCEDLGALAELAEALALANYPDPAKLNQAIAAAFQAAHPQEMPTTFTGDALYWLMETQATQPPKLDLPSSKYLLDHSGHRKPQAWQARIQSVLSAFDTEPEQALAATKESPKIWDDQGFVDEWAKWLGGDNLSEDALDWLDRNLQTSKIPLPWSTTQVRKDAAKTLWNKDYKNIAKCLYPGTSGFHSTSNYNERPAVNRQSSSYSSEGQATSVAEAAKKMGGVANNVLKALNNCMGTDLVWRSIDSSNFQESDHPLLELARYNDKTRVFSRGDRVTTLLEAIKYNPNLLKPMESQHPRLPVFELYASLHEQGSIANAAWTFVNCVYDNHPSYQERGIWWVALLESTDRRCRTSPSNSLENSMRAICRAINTNINNIDRETGGNILSRALKISKALFSALDSQSHDQFSNTLILK